LQLEERFCRAEKAGLEKEGEKVVPKKAEKARPKKKKLCRKSGKKSREKAGPYRLSLLGCKKFLN
jgi:hypothetical protein